jgi:predicted DNA-binding protein
MAIRLDDELHAQLAVVAQLEATTITDVIRVAIETHLEAKRKDPALAARAEAFRADIDAEALKRRDALSTLFETPPKSTGRRTRKSTSDDS